MSVCIAWNESILMSSASPAPKFTLGSTMRHVLVMTSTGTVGLIAIFLVDFINLFYISMLGSQELAAAIGYAGTVIFFTIAIGIGLAIAAGATVSRRLGAGEREAARRAAGTVIWFSVAVSILVVAGLWPNLEWVLAVIGARGETLAISTRFMQIVLPSMPFMCLAMVLGAVLRAVGDARRAMFVTLTGGIVTAILDPVFIFAMGLGVDGAAIVMVMSRLSLVVVGLYGAVRIHNLVGKPAVAHLNADLRALLAVALPAVLTNIATPVGNAIVTATIAPFGDDAVAGWAIIGRVIPVAFGAVFALSGAVGPIIGQNFGANLMDRVSSTVRDSLVCVLAYTLVVWILLFLLQQPIIKLFGATPDAAALITFFCSIAAAGFFFNGALFVSNAAFNNLGYPIYSTLFNWGKATIGTAPFVWVGADYLGANGVLAGQALGGVVFGLGAIWTSMSVVNKLARERAAAA